MALDILMMKSITMLTRVSLFTALLLVLGVYLQSCQGDSDDSQTQATPTFTTGPTVEPQVSILPEVPEDQRVLVTEEKILNREATIPPQCYTETERKFNPCYTCHQVYNRDEDNRLNEMDDGTLQGDYNFSDIGVTNHWSNLFVDRNAWLEQLTDEAIREYVDTENYSRLARRLETSAWEGFIPDLQDYHLAADAFDERGLALDGSYWVAFNYKPFLGTFWPTNGSTDDVVIRLPAAFREVNGEFNADAYFVNLSLIELTIKDLEETTLWPVDEQALNVDLDQNGVMESANRIRKRERYVGDASDIEIAFQQYPQGTEFMHSVRYVGLDENQAVVIPPRMKELRYMQKVNVQSPDTISARYAKERKEKLLGQLPQFLNRRDKGFDNAMGWYVSGFIEDYNGELRAQTFEERTFCMGCHTNIGTTIDSTFAFARKVTGAEGWQYIDLRGMPDAPSIAESDGEILRYLKRSGGGNEFRQNPEMVSKWFNPDGSIKEADVRAADVYTLLAPSVERTHKLNKAYAHIVRHQSFIFGRDATWNPSVNVFEEIDQAVPPLLPEHQFYGWDLRLDWSQSAQ